MTDFKLTFHVLYTSFCLYFIFLLICIIVLLYENMNMLHIMYCKYMSYIFYFVFYCISCRNMNYNLCSWRDPNLWSCSFLSTNSTAFFQKCIYCYYAIQNSYNLYTISIKFSQFKLKHSYILECKLCTFDFPRNFKFSVVRCPFISVKKKKCRTVNLRGPENLAPQKSFNSKCQCLVNSLASFWPIHLDSIQQN